MQVSRPLNFAASAGSAMRLRDECVNGGDKLCQMAA